MNRYRLFFTFCFSLLLHALLLIFIIQTNTKGFKKGIGDNPKIKISSFEFASFDSQARIPSNPLPPAQQKKYQIPKPNKSQNKQSQKPKPIQKKMPDTNTPKETTQEQETKNPDIQNDQENFLQNPSLPNEAIDSIDQPSPPTPIQQSLSYQLADQQTKKNISEFYGAEFGQLGLEEQEYILNNLAYIGRITQSYLRYPPNAGMLAQSGGNVVEFYLHPNGDISDLKIIKKSGFILLDRNSIKTIEIAYKDYPHPKTRTLIRFYINYYLIRN